jgi:hypothetical protein
MVSGLIGKCPGISFAVGGKAITAELATFYQHGGCVDVKNGKDISGKGTTTNGSAVRATSIDLKDEGN